MDIDTYRYLMSSLIQVFGALIAVDVVFLVFRYQDYQSRLSTITYELGRVAVMLEDYQRLLGGHADASRLATIEPKANVFKSLGGKVRMARIQKVQQDMVRTMARAEKDMKALPDTSASAYPRSQIEDSIAAQKKGLEELDRHHHIYTDLLRRMDDTRRLIPKMMGLPACLVLAFSLTLIPAEQLKAMSFLLPASLIVVAVSGVALYLLVRWAYQSFKEE